MAMKGYATDCKSIARQILLSNLHGMLSLMNDLRIHANTSLTKHLIRNKITTNELLFMNKNHITNCFYEFFMRTTSSETVYGHPSCLSRISYNIILSYGMPI